MMQLGHSVHDYQSLVQRWRALIAGSKLALTQIGLFDDFPIFEIHNRKPVQGASGLYLSAGIHGDEPASCWALLQWAEKNLEVLGSVPHMLFPCLNPWGLVNNCRFDKQGHDLNRIWDNPKSPLICSISSQLRGCSFGLSLNLHEDYDANGIYLYEPYISGKNDLLAGEILKAGQKILPIDSRKRIDGRVSKDGIIRPRISNPPSDGMPEAIYLVANHGRRHFTLETPSEESFGKRVKSQVRMIEKATHQIFKIKRN